MKIVTLTLSAAFDIHCNAEKIEVNHENLASISELDAGGKGVNISRALNSFGIENTAVVVLGEENSDDFIKKLEKENICLQKVLIPGRIRENITIHTADGKETRISFAGGKAPANLLSSVKKITSEILDTGDVITITGRIPDGLYIEEVKEYIKSLSEKGIKAVIDSRSFSLSDLAEVKPFLIKPNEEEIAGYIGSDVNSPESALSAAEKLSALGIENVMISLGKSGAVIASAEGSFFAPAPKIEAVSTIGAGDSSIAGFLYAMSKGLSTEDSLKAAVAFGSAACLTAGTKSPRKCDVEKMLGGEI